MSVKEGEVFTDSRYGTDLIVKYVNSIVVLAKDKSSGHSTIYRREEFAGEDPRFIKE